MLELVRLPKIENKMPKELSEGEQQRQKSKFAPRSNRFGSVPFDCDNCFSYEGSSTEKYHSFARLFARSLVAAKICRRREKFFERTLIFEKLERLDAIAFVQESSKSKPHSRFFGRFKICIACLKICKVSKVTTKHVKCRFREAVVL